MTTPSQIEQQTPVTSIDAPFPWFGGKSSIADRVWVALGNVAHYVEPFFGSGAVLLQRPHAPKFETVNDLDGMVANFWRATKSAPNEVADHADWPCNEADLHARHLWLVGRRESLTGRLMGDADWFDAKAAGWWMWGACNWIGSDWCSGKGPWVALNGVMTDSRQLPHLSSAQGVKRQLPHLSSAQGVKRKLPHLSEGRGVNRKLPHLSEGRGVSRKLFITEWIAALSDRLRDTRIACGDWTRVTGPAVLDAGGGVTGVFLDPPYDQAGRAEVYAMESHVAADVRKWCATNGSSPKMRIVLAGYDGEHNELQAIGWDVIEWKARGGYGSQGNGQGRKNAARERLWLSPHCMSVAPDLFSEGAA
jgi:site-specific DNA-adenine methylase